MLPIDVEIHVRTMKEVLKLFSDEQKTEEKPKKAKPKKKEKKKRRTKITK